MIYLDNASTTNFKPQRVVDSVKECLTKWPFNPNRSGNALATEMQKRLYKLRKKLSLLYCNDSAEHVAFTSGCTQALNLAIVGNAKRGHVVVSACEHNSVLRPVMQLQRKGLCKVTVVEPQPDGKISPQSVEEAMEKDTFLVCVTHASNVTGQRQELKDIGEIAHRHNALLLADCAQTVGYVPLDMAKNNVDLVAVGGHKGLHALQGAGALVFCANSAPRPIVFGGTGTESHLEFQPSTLPDSLESGTLPCPALFAMNSGIDWWLDNWRQNGENIAEMQNLLLENLPRIEGVKVYSQQNASGIVAFNVGNLDSTAVADCLANKFDVYVRGGLQCAPLMHKWLNTFEQGVVRASVSCVTTAHEVLTLLNGVEQIAKHPSIL